MMEAVAFNYNLDLYLMFLLSLASIEFIDWIDRRFK